MSPTIRDHRRWLVYGILIFIVGGQAFDVARGREHWPFSPYAMYSKLNKDRTQRSIRVVWVNDGPAPNETEIRATWVRTSFISLMQDGDPNRDRILRTMREQLAHEQSSRTRHRASKAVGIRVYEQTFQMTPELQDKPQPERSRVLYEVMDEPTKAG